MRKGIIGLAVVVIAVSAWTTDLNPVGNNVCGAGAIRIQPSTITTGDEFKKLYDNLDNLLSDAEVAVISTDDGNWWTYDGNTTGKPWDYMMIKFEKPTGYTGGTCYWQVRLDSQGIVTIWRWDYRPWPTGQRWTDDYSNDGGSNPPTESFSVPASYFNDDGDLWFLVEGMTDDNELNMDCDVVDIHY